MGHAPHIQLGPGGIHNRRQQPLQRLEIVPKQIRRLRLEAADARARLWVERLFNRGGRSLGTQVTALPGGSGWALQWQQRQTQASGI